MLGKTGKALLMVLALSLIVTGVAYAEEATPESRFKVAGTITSVDPSAATFGLQSRGGESYVFYVTPETRFVSRDGSINSLADLEPQMAAVVVAIRNDAGRLQAQTNERTRFRSRDGSIQGLADVEVGMLALIVAVEVDGGFPLAVGVAAAHQDDVKPEPFRVNGEITRVIPGQQTFILTTTEGREYTFLVSERTRFRSRDGSIQDIHDLKQGMLAIVVAVESNDGGFLALTVAAGNPGGGQTNVRAAGRIVGLGNRSITLQTKDGSSMTFSVDGSTAYRSRDGSIQGFEDLRVGMAAAIGAKEIGNGQLKATWVAAGLPQSQNDAAPSERPPAEPELRRESAAGGDRNDL